MFMNNIDKLKKMIDEVDNIVVITGAGVSTDSGLKDFRSSDGIYNIKLDYNKSPEYMLSNMCFYNETDLFYDFYKKYMIVDNIVPNNTHNYLKKLEDSGKLKCVITQNIDGLHKLAGNKNVYEIHGSIYRNYCIKCHKEYDLNYVKNSNGVPRCDCGGIIKPDVVLYGEMLPEEEYNNSIKYISKCDMLMVLGTSLTVFPASDLINYFRGKYLVIINRDSTSYDNRADLVIHDNLKDVFKRINVKG